MKPRLADKDVFDESIKGVFGSFGWGGGVQVNYVQTALKPLDLSKISLVAEIDGSDRWPVRDLFQREVDTERVEQGILPWLQDGTRVKFFNPLTLVLIPFDPAGRLVLPHIPHLVRSVKDDAAGDEWVELTAADAYRFRWRIQEQREYPEFAEVGWATSRVRLVAIDGQHRLSALKRYLRDSKGPGYEAFLQWHIPVVVAGLHRASVDKGHTAAHTALDVIRHVFVSINTQAQVPTRTRQILLDDVNPGHVCVQELLQQMHENDVRDPEKADPSVPPLSLFDWRGSTHGGRETHSPIALKSAGELADWLEWYILGEPFSEEQLDALGFSATHAIRNHFSSGDLHPGDHLVVRDTFRKNVLPGVLHLLQEFTPYKTYIAKVREIERKAEKTSDASRHALSYLRFGTHRGSQLEDAEIRKAIDAIVHDILDAKALTQLLADDIGMRGVVYAFGALRAPYDQWQKGKSARGWMPYATWFVKYLNDMDAAGWFAGQGHADRQFITHTPAGDVLNFKLAHASRALGALTVVVVGAYAAAASDLVTSARFETLWNTYALDDRRLRGTLRSGYRKRYMDELGEKYPSWSRKKREDGAMPLANKATAAHLTRLRKRLESVIEG